MMRSWQKDLLKSTNGVPNSGWITFQIRSEEGLSRARWLMRLSQRALLTVLTRSIPD